MSKVNPFQKNATGDEGGDEPTREERIESALLDDSGGDEDNDSAVEDDDSEQGPTGDESDENPLLASDDDDDDAEDGDDDDDDAEKPARKRKGKKAADRIAELVEERNDARTALAELQTELEALRETATSNATFAELVREHYGEFTDPEKAVASDAAFMSALERAAKTDPTVRAVAAKIHDTLGDFSVRGDKDRTASSETTGDSKEKVSSIEERLVRRDAKRLIESTLTDAAKVRPEWKGVISKHVLANAADLVELTEGEVIALTKDFLKAEGLSASEVVMGAAKGGGKKKPSTAGGKGNRTATRQRGGDSDGDKKSDGPKNLKEFENQREKTRAALFSELTQTV